MTSTRPENAGSRVRMRGAEPSQRGPRTRTRLVVLTVCVGLAGAAAAPAGWSLPDTPGAPRAVAAVAGESSVTLTWKAPASNGTSPVSGYAITSSPTPASGATTHV